jgi:hypothetical protein
VVAGLTTDVVTPVPVTPMCSASYFRLSVGPKYRSTLPFSRPRKMGALSAKYWTVHGFWPSLAQLAALLVSRV